MGYTREDFIPDVGGFLDGIDGEITGAIFEIASGEYADAVLVGDSTKKPPVVIVLTVEADELEKPARASSGVRMPVIIRAITKPRATRSTSSHSVKNKRMVAANNPSVIQLSIWSMIDSFDFGFWLSVPNLT